MIAHSYGQLHPDADDPKKVGKKGKAGVEAGVN
jgi:hypothetical protein